MPKEKPANPWLLATRPKTLCAGICPVLLGTAIAYLHGSFHLWSAILCLLGSILIQIGTNFANDYYDFVKGADTEDRLGPTRATQAGLVTPQQMKQATIFIFIAASICALLLALRGGYPMVILLLVSIISGIAYTGGPFPLGYNGLGDLFAFIFFGPVATAGTYYVQSLSLPIELIWAGFIPGGFSVALISINNMRDIPTDSQVGKRTLAVLLGRTFARLEYTLALLMAFILPFFLWFQNLQQPLYLSLSLLALFPIISPLKTVWASEEGPPLNEALGNTGKTLFIHTILLCLILIFN